MKDFKNYGFQDLNELIRNKDASGKSITPVMSMKPIVLDVEAANPKWARANGVQAIITPGHSSTSIRSPVPSLLQSQTLDLARLGYAPQQTQQFANEFVISKEAPRMTIVGFAGRANKDLTITNSTGELVNVPAYSRLLSGALLVRNGNSLTKYNIITHNPGRAIDISGKSPNNDYHGEVFRFYDPYHHDMQGGFAFNSEATIEDANNAGNSTRAGSMLMIFDE